MKIENASVITHANVGDGGYRLLVLASPGIAPHVRPGQFVHLRIPQLDGAVLRRPFSVFKADRDSLAILYKTVGRGTAAMRALAPGEPLSLMGPLGNGFPLELNGADPVLVAGGYGMAALYLLARDLACKGVVFVGGAAARDILCVPEFEDLGWQVRIATEDGSRGRRGLVTVLLDEWLHRRDAHTRIQAYACGPNGMLQAVAERALAGGWQAWLSMDRHMGCGAGACLACVQKVRRGKEVAWARVCKDGPVFEAGEIVWIQG